MGSFSSVGRRFVDSNSWNIKESTLRVLLHFNSRNKSVRMEKMNLSATRLIARKIPGVRWIMNFYRTMMHHRDLGRYASTREIFTGHFQSNYWGNKESVSGDGSTVEYTENIRKELPKLFSSLHIKQLLDAPCGDFNWFRHLNLPDGIAYLGCDIVEQLVIENKRCFETSLRRFSTLDIIRDQLPEADLWICRDVLFHFSNADILSTLRNFKKSKIRYLLTSNHTEVDKNSDVPTGSFRLLNLELKPFSFPAPIAEMDDWIEGFPVRQLCLWDRDSVPGF